MPAEHDCAQRFAADHPDDAARLTEQFPPGEAAAFLDALPTPIAAGLIGAISPAAAAEFLEAMDRERGAAVVAALRPDIAVSLLRRIPSAERPRLMGALPPPVSRSMEGLLTCPSGTVGASADPTALAVAGDATVAVAQQHLRRYPGGAHHHVYVVDRSHALLGVLHLRDLMQARPKTRLDAVMHPASARLPAGARITSVTAHPAWRDLDALPVVDDAGIFLGILRHRQLRDLEPSSGGGALVGTLVSLGELYWFGLSALLPTAPATAASPNWSTQPSSGDDHAR
jgi:magnesium transporter